MNCERNEISKAKTQEGLTLEMEIGIFVGKGNINSRSQTDKSDNSAEQYEDSTTAFGSA